MPSQCHQEQVSYLPSITSMVPHCTISQMCAGDRDCGYTIDCRLECSGTSISSRLGSVWLWLTFSTSTIYRPQSLKLHCFFPPLLPTQVSWAKGWQGQGVAMGTHLPSSSGTNKQGRANVYGTVSASPLADYQGAKQLVVTNPQSPAMVAIESIGIPRVPQGCQSQC